jgi:hypothetical protein
MLRSFRSVLQSLRTVRATGKPAERLSFTVHDSARVINSDPLTIETATQKWFYACWLDMPRNSIVAGASAADSFDLLVHDGAVSVSVQRGDESIIFESSPLEASPAPYPVHVPPHLLASSSRIMIRNVSEQGASRFQVWNLHRAAPVPTADVAERRLAAELAVSRVTGLRWLPLPEDVGKSLGLPDPTERIALVRALAAALDRDFPDVARLRGARFVRDAVGARYPGGHIMLVLPFDAGAGADEAGLWLACDGIARAMLRGQSAGDALREALVARSPADRSVPEVSVICILAEALTTAVLLSPRDLHSLSRLAHIGVVLSASVDDLMVGTVCRFDDRGRPQLAGEHVRRALHRAGFFDVGLVTRAGNGTLDLDSAAVSRAHLDGFAHLSPPQEEAAADATVPLPAPLILATHGPGVARVDI